MYSISLSSFHASRTSVSGSEAELPQGEKSHFCPHEPAPYFLPNGFEALLLLLKLTFSEYRFQEGKITPTSTMVYARTQQTFSTKVQVLNILVFRSRMVCVHNFSTLLIQHESS